ncbi:ABC transporter ATP-binding protein [Acidisoma silvae]|uniref:Spermidine/putrescine import ATP-binding protein PotA n=1 Tax=Acidisoma silvae TaxID=2802396 RepID=A0A963YP35_9PROT|nr:ABC transporter ATP-binding protein [Acidisoma silvae]MCB8873740.1 ABC transporter ATP-binding protein [Acidisoma silvae]
MLVPSASDAAPIIELRGVEKFYGASRAVQTMDLSVRQGEFLALLGPSGCGKTTTLRMIAGFEAPTKGDILLHGRDIKADPPYRRPVNTVFQDYALFPHMTVAENVGFGLSVARRPRAEIKTRVTELLTMVGLGDKAGRSPAQLSGGQRQRVALARALARAPEVLLLDEPLSALDAHLRQQMQIELKQIQARLGLTFIIVTHDQSEALTLADRIVVMNHGVIAQIGTPAELYDSPASPFVARFLGAANLIPCRLAERRDHAVTLAIGGTSLSLDIAGGSVPATQNLLLCVRPERLLLLPEAKPGHSLPARVESRIFLGLVERLQLRLPDDTIVNLDLPHRGAMPPALGETIHLGFEPGTTRLFVAETNDDSGAD